VYEALKGLLREGVIYHCGPVVRYLPPSPEGVEGRWEFVAAGPTTSIREEVYEPEVIEHFGLRGVIGKGGMGPNTLRACQEHGAAYFHAVGGAASLIAAAVKEVVAVHKKDDFGVPEAFWVIRVEDFPVVVTMDTHGRSIHEEVEATSKAALDRLMGS
jgi:fumarate hydratase class I